MARCNDVAITMQYRDGKGSVSQGLGVWEVEYQTLGDGLDGPAMRVHSVYFHAPGFKAPAALIALNEYLYRKYQPRFRAFLESIRIN